MNNKKKNNNNNNNNNRNREQRNNGTRSTGGAAEHPKTVAEQLNVTRNTRGTLQNTNGILA